MLGMECTEMECIGRDYELNRCNTAEDMLNRSKIEHEK